MIGGYVKDHRRILDWEWFTDVPTAHLWEYIRLKANYEDNCWRGIEIKKGSFVSSLEKIASETGLSIQQVRTSLAKLKSTKEITTTSTNKYTQITILKWEEYQVCNELATNNQQAIQQTNNKQITTNKEYKNIRNKYICNLPSYDPSKNLDITTSEANELLALMGKDN